MVLVFDIEDCIEDSQIYLGCGYNIGVYKQIDKFFKREDDNFYCYYKSKFF